MKFHWFHLMPYPDLPEDLRQRTHSVWVDIPSRLFDPKRGHAVYNEYLDELEFADAVGFDGICVNEHHQNGYGLMPSPNLIAASLARRTTNAKLVLMGNSVALYNPPTRVAEEMAMLEVISGGRLVAGFPVGTAMDTVFCYGQTPATLRDKYREAVRLIMRAWTEPEPFTFNGKFTQLRYVNIWPRPLQQPHPPVWVPGGASVETWDWCIENDFLYANLSYFGYERAAKNLKGFWEAVDRLGADPNPYRTGFLQFVGVADSDAEAERLYARHAQYFYNRCLYLHPPFTTAPGYTSLETVRKGLESQVSLAAMQSQSDVSWKEIVDRGYVIAGSVDTVVDRLNALADTLQVGHLMVMCQYGDMPKDTVLYNTERMAREVLPRLRHRFDEWEDRWWPRDTLKERAAPAPVAALA
jgi:alkanesulfonate monooxygenase SsuD/methylene tetrahydromethanopterin reductase-like flavin-dependent oxidoreductase (luciferase family)